MDSRLHKTELSKLISGIPNARKYDISDYLQRLSMESPSGIAQAIKVLLDEEKGNQIQIILNAASQYAITAKEKEKVIAEVLENGVRAYVSRIIVDSNFRTGLSGLESFHQALLTLQAWIPDELKSQFQSKLLEESFRAYSAAYKTYNTEKQLDNALKFYEYFTANNVNELFNQFSYLPYLDFFDTICLDHLRPHFLKPQVLIKHAKHILTLLSESAININIKLKLIDRLFYLLRRNNLDKKVIVALINELPNKVRSKEFEIKRNFICSEIKTYTGYSYYSSNGKLPLYIESSNSIDKILLHVFHYLNESVSDGGLYIQGFNIEILGLMQNLTQIDFDIDGLKNLHRPLYRDQDPSDSFKQLFRLQLNKIYQRLLNSPVATFKDGIYKSPRGISLKENAELLQSWKHIIEYLQENIHSRSVPRYFDNIKRDLHAAMENNDFNWLFKTISFLLNHVGEELKELVKDVYQEMQKNQPPKKAGQYEPIKVFLIKAELKDSFQQFHKVSEKISAEITQLQIKKWAPRRYNDIKKQTTLFETRFETLSKAIESTTATQDLEQKKIEFERLLTEYRQYGKEKIDLLRYEQIHCSNELLQVDTQALAYFQKVPSSERTEDAIFDHVSVYFRDLIQHQINAQSIKSKDLSAELTHLFNHLHGVADVKQLLIAIYEFIVNSNKDEPLNQLFTHQFLIGLTRLPKEITGVQLSLNDAQLRDDSIISRALFPALKQCLRDENHQLIINDRVLNLTFGHELALFKKWKGFANGIVSNLIEADLNTQSVGYFFTKNSTTVSKLRANVENAENFKDLYIQLQTLNASVKNRAIKNQISNALDKMIKLENPNEADFALCTSRQEKIFNLQEKIKQLRQEFDNWNGHLWLIETEQFGITEPINNASIAKGNFVWDTISSLETQIKDVSLDSATVVLNKLEKQIQSLEQDTRFLELRQAKLKLDTEADEKKAQDLVNAKEEEQERYNAKLNSTKQHAFHLYKVVQSCLEGKSVTEKHNKILNIFLTNLEAILKAEKDDRLEKIMENLETVKVGICIIKFESYIATFDRSLLSNEMKEVLVNIEAEITRFKSEKYSVEREMEISNKLQELSLVVLNSIQIPNTSFDDKPSYSPKMFSAVVETSQQETRAKEQRVALER